jgi:class 3 adenylate cyclase
MNPPPETRYAWNGDVALAYQVLGEGPVDLLYLQGWTSNIDLAWDSAFLAPFLRSLATGRRLITMDRRGWGLSDRFSPSEVPAFETLVDDVLVVLNAAGSERAVIFASIECAALASLVAAAHPDRVSALVLCDPLVSFTSTEDRPGANTAEEWETFFTGVRERFPHPGWWEGPEDHPERAWFDRLLRASEAPGALIAEFRRFRETDIRPLLASVRVPTLVLIDPHGQSDTDPANGRDVSARIPGARLVEVEDAGGLNWLHWYGRADGILRAIDGFLRAIREEEAHLDRVLATVLFTDIVGSTEHAAALGDRGWRDLVERHHAVVRAMLARYGGVEVDTAGDGFFATFDGPARAIRCAQAIADGLRPLGIEIRAGVHTGEVETIDGKAGGIAVNIGARVGAEAGPSEIVASRTVRDLVAGSGLVFEDRGEHELQGVPEPWHLYRVASERPDQLSYEGLRVAAWG